MKLPVRHAYLGLSNDKVTRYLREFIMKLPVRHAYLEGLPYTLAVLDEYDRRPRVVSRVRKQTRIADKILGPINGRKENAIECASLNVNHQESCRGHGRTPNVLMIRGDGWRAACTSRRRDRRRRRIR